LVRFNATHIPGADTPWPWSWWSAFIRRGWKCGRVSVARMSNFMQIVKKWSQVTISGPLRNTKRKFINSKR
jgi:hypothetical protein